MHGDTAVSALIVLVVLVVYMIPGVVAWSRGHRNAAAIITMNVVLGWTFLGWTIALIWSMTNNVRREPLTWLEEKELARGEVR